MDVSSELRCPRLVCDDEKPLWIACLTRSECSVRFSSALSVERARVDGIISNGSFLVYRGEQSRFKSVLPSAFEEFLEFLEERFSLD